MLNVVIMVSGGGTNLQAIIDAVENGRITNARLAGVIASNPDAYALKRAEKHGIPSTVVSRKAISDAEAFDHAVLAALEQYQADLVVLAGYLSILGKKVTDAYAYRMINIHPSLIPSFCGPGYYGLRVHEAALGYGVRVTGATVHFVNEEADAGAIILQKPVAVEENDTPETLQRRVMEQAEWEILPKAIDLFCNGKITVSGNKVHITV